MVSQIIELCGSSIGASLNWLTILDGALSFFTVALASFTLYTMCRVLIKPLIGYASSDLAKRTIKGNKQNKSSGQKGG